jgi:hypothetical protein
MKPKSLYLCLLLGAGLARGADDWFDRVEDVLTFSAADGRTRARLSGTAELEHYDVQLPAPGVIDTDGHGLTVPRLSLFLDGQFGPALYLFAQARADRGFDPGDYGSQVRLDEYALRFTAAGNTINLQVGKFATVVGNWTGRHGSWANPFITAPLPYEHLTGIWDTEAVRNSSTLLQWSHVRPGLPAAVVAEEKELRVPIIWGPSYTTGVALSGEFGRWRYAAEAKAGALSSRPVAWQHSAEDRTHPTVSARLGYRPNQMWILGLSGSTGPYLRAAAARSMAPGFGRGDYSETVVAADAAFAWHHWQLWSEIFRARFAIPRVGDAETIAWYVEAKYKFTPQFFAALRWNQQGFNRIPDRLGLTTWEPAVQRMDFSPGYRFTPHTQLKLQYSLQRGDTGVSRRHTRTLAAQVVLRF